MRDPLHFRKIASDQGGVELFNNACCDFFGLLVEDFHLILLRVIRFSEQTIAPPSHMRKHLQAQLRK